MGIAGESNTRTAHTYHLKLELTYAIYTSARREGQSAFVRSGSHCEARVSVIQSQSVQTSVVDPLPTALSHAKWRRAGTGSRHNDGRELPDQTIHEMFWRLQPLEHRIVGRASHDSPVAPPPLTHVQAAVKREIRSSRERRFVTREPRDD
jgi:hypothetical protein